ncbi:MAG: hypothetical protein QME94_10050, partial [Anaerolineae bacterium]|nr:hypothetical protein [Anaerolineae bacterium]
MLNESHVRVLDVDLGTGRVRALRRADLQCYLGGAGLATALLAEHARADLDPVPGRARAHEVV